MRRRQLLLAGLLSLLTTVVIIITRSHSGSITPLPPPINQLVVFGDSLSDVGVSYRLSNGNSPPNPPYFQGRFSNGRVWAEYLADLLGLTADQVSNFAGGGATTGLDADRGVPGMTAQVRSFLQANPTLNGDGLYALWAGANDYFQGRQDVAVPVENLRAAIAALAQAGARRFLIGNLPDLGQTPAARGQEASATLSQLSQSHNQALRQTLAQMRQDLPGVQLVLLDIEGLFGSAIANPAQFGFTNVTSSCLTAAGLCTQPGQFLFWDGIHPTTAAHQSIAANAQQTLETAGLLPRGQAA
jgi:thermolabile hemolysin